MLLAKPFANVCVHFGLGLTHNYMIAKENLTRIQRERRRFVVSLSVFEMVSTELGYLSHHESRKFDVLINKQVCIINLMVSW